VETGVTLDPRPEFNADKFISVQYFP